MNKPMVDGIEMEMGSGNVFADLTLPDADRLRINSGLVIEITRTMRRLHLTHKTAAQQMGTPTPRCRPCSAGTFPTCPSAS